MTTHPTHGGGGEICQTCHDTHLMPCAGTFVNCTRCPTPCERCAGGPYCRKTPCSCDCHRFKERYDAFARFNPEHVKRRLTCLATNLATAAGLARSFQLGSKYADGLWDVDQHGKLWKPGCGKAAPK
jgi:hypothetical protein